MPGPEDQVQRLASAGNDLELQLVTEARAPQRVAVRSQPCPPPFSSGAFPVGRFPVGPAAEDQVQMVRLHLLAAIEPVRAECHDDLTSGIPRQLPDQAERHPDVAPAIEDGKDRIPPRLRCAQQRAGSGASFRPAGRNGHRQPVQRTETAVQQGLQVLEAVAPFLGKNQVYPIPLQPHPRGGIVPEKPVQGEHGRTLFTARVLTRPGKGIHIGDVRPRAAGTGRRLKQDGPPGVQVLLVQTVLGSCRRREPPQGVMTIRRQSERTGTGRTGRRAWWVARIQTASPTLAAGIYQQ